MDEKRVKTVYNKHHNLKGLQLKRFNSGSLFLRVYAKCTSDLYYLEIIFRDIF
jgi:hypothetical protein